MSIFLQYILKLSIGLAFTWMFYQVFLRRLTFYNWNRVYLLAYSVLAFLLPFVNIGLVVEESKFADHALVQVVPVLENFSSENRPGSSQAVDWMVMSFAIGCAVLCGRLLIQQISFRRLKRSARLISEGTIRLYQVDDDITPFSFGNSVFINRHRHTQEDLAKIIHHEFIHVKDKHSIDMIWAELLCIINWYNPFAWLIRNSIRQNLEFIADQKVVRNGIDKKQYQYLLLKVTGYSHYSIAANFNFTSLKKRIAMMNKMQSAKAHLMKFIFVLPMVAILLLAFRNHIPKQLSNSHVARGSHVIDTVPRSQETPANRQFPNNVSAIDEVNKKVTVTLKNGTKEVYNLANADEKAAFERKYGKMPPPPPPPVPPAVPAPDPVPAPPAPAPDFPSNVSSMNITDNKVSIRLKDGTVENYDLSKPQEKDAFDKKYGKRPTAPKPAAAPVPPKVATTVTIHDLEAKISSTPAAPTVVTGALSVQVSDVKPVIATTLNVEVSDLVVEIGNNSTPEDLATIRSSLASKNYVLTVLNSEHRDGKLVRMEGVISEGDNKARFSAHDFHRILIYKVDYKEGKTGFIIRVLDGKISTDHSK